MFLLTLRGTPTLYYGEEIGMVDVPIPAECMRDPWEHNVPGLGLGRDPERTPMQWTAELAAGFSARTPWLPLADDYPTRNVQAQSRDSESILSLYRALLRLRHAEPALAIGDYMGFDFEPTVLSFQRRHANTTFTVLLNFTADARSFALPAELGRSTLVLSTHSQPRAASIDTNFVLRANEGVLLRQNDP